MKVLAMIGLVILASCNFGCAPTPLPTEKSIEQMTPMERAQAAINEANADITAAAMTLEQDYKAGLLTYEAYDAMGDTLVGYAHRTDMAQALVRSGVPGAAEQANISRELARSFLMQVRAKRKKPAAVAPDGRAL